MNMKEQAETAIAEYNESFVAGGELPYPQWAVDFLKQSISRSADAAFLNWVADRLVHIYKESPNVDFVRRLRDIAKDLNGGT